MNDSQTEATSGDLPVRLLTLREWAAWRDGVVGLDVQKAKIIEQGWVPMLVQDDGLFQWFCPGCGGCAYGTLGLEPVSGWDEPRWVLTDRATAPTMTPSLGCRRWREGTCIGHWWLRAGRLVLA